MEVLDKVGDEGGCLFDFGVELVHYALEGLAVLLEVEVSLLGVLPEISLIQIFSLVVGGFEHLLDLFGNRRGRGLVKLHHLGLHELGTLLDLVWIPHLCVLLG